METKIIIRCLEKLGVKVHRSHQIPHFRIAEVRDFIMENIIDRDEVNQLNKNVLMRFFTRPNDYHIQDVVEYISYGFKSDFYDFCGCCSDELLEFLLTIPKPESMESLGYVLQSLKAYNHFSGGEIKELISSPYRNFDHNEAKLNFLKEGTIEKIGDGEGREDFVLMKRGYDSVWIDFSKFSCTPHFRALMSTKGLKRIYDWSDFLTEQHSILFEIPNSRYTSNLVTFHPDPEKELDSNARAVISLLTHTNVDTLPSPEEVSILKKIWYMNMALGNPLKIMTINIENPIKDVGKYYYFLEDYDESFDFKVFVENAMYQMFRIEKPVSELVSLINRHSLQNAEGLRKSFGEYRSDYCVKENKINF